MYCDLLSKVFDISPFGMLILDKGGRITDANVSGAAMLEFVPEEMTGRHVGAFLLDASKKRVQKYLGHLNPEESSRQYVVTKSDRPLLICVTTKPLGADSFLVTFHDPSEYSVGDTLTKAMNRDQFFVALNKLNAPYSLLFIDLNKFKAVNDNLGHITGDFVLKTAAQRIRGMLRKTDIFCRYGGDEFVIVIPGTEVNASAISKKIKALIEEPIRIREHLVEISASVGIAMSNESADIDDLIHIADQRMYEEKV
jgi:diguanylate cyclase (GGDEF)-like protein